MENNIEDWNKKLKNLQDQRSELLEEKKEFEPGTIEWWNTQMQIVNDKITEIQNIIREMQSQLEKQNKKPENQISS